jgi:uncharacterized membrane protein YebE (DUF533 family)
LAVVTPRLVRPGARVRRVVCRIARAGALVALVVAVRHLAGVWVAAGIVALAAVGGLIAALAALDAWATARTRGPAPTAAVVPTPMHEAPDHVAFARVLAAVSAAYLTACEREDPRR